MSSIDLTLDDQRAIERVLLAYCTGIDKRDWRLFRSCFSDEFTGDYGEFGQWTSGEDITVAMEKMHAGLGLTLHRLTNVVAVAKPPGAHVRSYVDAILSLAAPGEPPRRGVGLYEDDFINLAGDWKISARRFVAVHLA